MTLVHHEHEMAALWDRLTAMEERTHQLEATVVALQAENAQLRQELAIRDALIRKFQGLLFGPKSEQAARAPHIADPPGHAAASDPSPGPASEPASDSQDLQEAASLGEPPAKRPRGQQRGAPGHGRRLYDELPPREVVHALPEETRRCPQCGEAYTPCGTEDALEIEWEVLIRRVIHKRLKYVRTCMCPSVATLLTAPAPPKLLPKGLLAVSTITHVLVNKYLHGQPIHRQLHELELQSGVRLAAGTMVGVLDKVGEVLRPLYEAILLHLRAADHWHADETRWMQYGDEHHHRWWLWVFASPDAVLLALDPSRSRAVPRRVFGLDAGYWEDAPDALGHLTARGRLTCDRLKSYQGLPEIQLTGCWAHVRRDFKELAQGYPALAAWGWAWVERIGTLYHLTGLRRRYSPGTEAFRQADATVREHVEQLARVRETELAGPRLLPAARKALESLKRHWDELTVFLEHPEIPLDNNEAERLLRTSVVGRKNFYGSGSYTNGDLVECAYTVLLTADKNGLNPLTYLRAYLEACAINGGQAPTNLERFLPWKASTEDLALWKLPPKAN